QARRADAVLHRLFVLPRGLGPVLQRGRAVQTGAHGGRRRDRARAERTARRRRSGSADALGRRAARRAGARTEGRGRRLQPAARAEEAQVTAVREAIVLPLLLLMVALVGGVEPGARIAFVAPSLFSLVLAALM